MSTDPRWTEQTAHRLYRELGHFLIQEGALMRLEDFAEHILGAVADMGLLIQPGGTVREEWVAEVDAGDGYRPSPTRFPYIADDEAAIDAYMRGIIRPKRKARRTVHTGRWSQFLEGQISSPEQLLGGSDDVE